MPRFGPAGQQIAYQVHPGPMGAPPIVLQHGFTASAASFLANIEDLTAHFTVVTVELLGHGESDAPAGIEPYRPGPACARLAGLFDHLGYDRVLLCGHSLGAALAIRFALDVPGRLAGLVVMNSSSAAGTPAWRERARAGMREMARRVREHGVDIIRGTPLYPAASRRLPSEARAAIERDFARLRPEGVAGTAEGLTIEVNAFERLGELAVPILVVIGDRDRPFVEAVPAFLAALPPELVSTVTLHGAGHAANLEQPGAFRDAVVGFARTIGYLREAQSAGDMSE